MKTILAAVAATAMMTGIAHSGSADIYTPRNPSAVFNEGTAWLCTYPTDVGKFRDLLAAGEQQAALAMPGCISVEQPLEAIETDRIGNDLLQVTVVKGDKAFDLWTEPDLFRTHEAWVALQCQASGKSYSECSKLAYGF
jgi:hypothetical protein